MRQDDIVMNELLRHEAEVTRLRQMEEALTRADAETLRAQQEYDKAKLRLDKIEQRISEGSRAFPAGQHQTCCEPGSAGDEDVGGACGVAAGGTRSE